MRVVLLAIGVLGLTAVLGAFEPAPASAKPVTSDEVQMVTEKMVPQSDQPSARQRNGNHHSIRHLYRYAPGHRSGD